MRFHRSKREAKTHHYFTVYSTRFDRPTKQVPAFIGIEPLENESAGKSKSTQISRAGSSLARFLLGQSANIVARYDKRFKTFYKRLSKRKPKPVAKTATARKVLVKLVIMMRDNITAEEFDVPKAMDAQ